MDAKGAVEAALFASADNLKISDIAERTGIPEEEVRTALMDLRRDYDGRNSAIVIAKIGTEFRMMLRSEYSEYTGMFGKAEMSGGLMRTLSTIAYNQPVLQSELVRTRGPRGYDDVHRLIELGFVSGSKKGQTLELTTTKKFSEYFGIGSTRKADIRKWIESQATNSKAQQPSDDGQQRSGCSRPLSPGLPIALHQTSCASRLHHWCVTGLLPDHPLSHPGYNPGARGTILKWVQASGFDIMTEPDPDTRGSGPEAPTTEREEHPSREASRCPCCRGSTRYQAA